MSGYRWLPGQAPMQERTPSRLSTLTRRTIQQVNYAATVVPDLQFVDLNTDGTLEILVPILRNDSLYVGVVSADGRKQDRFFVTAGQPRQEPEGEIAWDPWVTAAFMRDVTQDGAAELILGVTTRYAQQPRGVWVFSWPDAQLLGQVEVGAYLKLDEGDEAYVDDFDGDGRLELFFTSSASDNGGRAGGLSDRHAYVGAFELGATPRLDWHRRVGNIWSSASGLRGDLDGDGASDFVTYKWVTRGRSDPTFIQRIDPGTGRVLRQRLFADQIRDAAMVDIDGDARDEVLVLDTKNVLHVLGDDFQTLQRRTLPVNAKVVTVLPDADNDRREEIAVATDAGTFFLGQGLTIKAFTETKASTWRVAQRGNQQQPFLHAQIGSRQVRLLRLGANPWYVWHRYGPWSMALLGFAVVAGAGWGGRRLYRRNQALEKAAGRLLRTSPQGALIVAPNANAVEQVNDAARTALNLQDDAPPEAIRDQAPALLNLARRSCKTGEPVEEEVPLGRAGTDGSPSLRVRVVPLTDQRGLVQLPDVRSEAGDDDYRAWGLMARRVAHDLKNPLTSILLTLQRLQMEYRDRAPGLAGDLDAYTARIEERIEHLRRMTKNFMKFMDAEAAALHRTDLNHYLREQAEHLRPGLPPDINLALKLHPDVPAVNLDAEQVQSVLENLVANAIDALPDGGQITIATRLERGLRFDDGHPPRDYAEIEVLDTGTGMDADTRARLFEPGFTTTEDGTGLGLSIVRKIIADHNGHIQVESERGTGTAFCIYLPVPDTQPEPEHDA